MKKASTWYSFALAIVNVLLAQSTCYLAAGWINCIRILGPAHAFKATQDYLQCDWWPYVFVAIFVALGVLSIRSRMPDRMLYHTMIVLLVIETIILLAAQLFLLLPLIGTNYSLSV